MMNREERKEEISMPDIESPAVLEPIGETQQHEDSSSITTDIVESSSNGTTIQVADVEPSVVDDTTESLVNGDNKEEVSAPDIESPKVEEPTGGYIQLNEAFMTNTVAGGSNSIKIDIADALPSTHVDPITSFLPGDNVSNHILDTIDEGSAADIGRGADESVRKHISPSAAVQSGSWIDESEQGAIIKSQVMSISDQDNAMSPGTSDADNMADGSSGADRNVTTSTLFSNVRRRTSHVTDLVTGTVAGRPGQVARIRTNSETSDTPRGSRLRESMKNGFSKLFRFNRRDDFDEDDPLFSNLRASMHGRLMVTQSMHSTGSKSVEVPEGMASNVQYRLQVTKAKAGMATRMLGWIGFSPGQSGIYEDAGDPTSGCACFGVRPNELVIRYLNWTFRASFVAVIFSGALAFFGLNLFFALLIWWSGKSHPTCIFDNGAVFGTTSSSFSDAFALSWTTFSTSGYGLIFPATSAVEPDVKKCIGITLITSLESFVGVLFGSCCGAVIFGKISRIQSYAQVIFSDPIVVRYGKGVLAGHDDDASSVGSAAKGGDGGEGNEEARQPLPCPVLEFRLVNNFHSKTGGEIIDASMNIIASIDERQACPTIRAAARRHHRKGKSKKVQASNRSSSRTPLRRNQMNQMSSNSLAIPAIPETMPLSKSDKESNQSTHSHYSSHPAFNKNHQAFQEDPSGHLIPPRIFSRLALQTGHDHPFFKRVWVAQHVIDEHSPLLKAEARQMVNRNHGYWPEELNSYEAVRDSIHFDQILVSFSGTSNVDASRVYAQKAYQWIDLNIGYRFVNLLYRDDRDGSLRVDTSLINDVVEQAGGGGEPFIEVEGNHKHHDMFVL